MMRSHKPKKVGTTCLHHSVPSVPEPWVAVPKLTSNLSHSSAQSGSQKPGDLSKSSIFQQLILFLWSTELSCTIGATRVTNNSSSLTLSERKNQLVWRKYSHFLCQAACANTSAQGMVGCVVGKHVHSSPNPGCSVACELRNSVLVYSWLSGLSRVDVNFMAAEGA